MDLRPNTHCRISGESLEDSEVLFKLESCPLPGIYPETAEASLNLKTPLKIVQAKGSGFTQLAHCFDDRLYSQYAFAGGGAGAYRAHLEKFADKVGDSFDHDSSILEVGCGDGFLVKRLLDSGYPDVFGIDPSRAAEQAASPNLVRGFFPNDLPDALRGKKFNLIICRHVLEHIEQPVSFLSEMAASLADNGQLWIEVPDLDSTLSKNLWSNFYQIHCNYFSEKSLDLLAKASGLRCLGGEIVDVFGGSLLRKYKLGIPVSLDPPTPLVEIQSRFSAYKERLDLLATLLPEGTVGYGAAERTATTLGASSSLEEKISRIYDGNPLLAGRFLAGTSIPIFHKKELFAEPPAAVVLFAISNAKEILAEWRRDLPASLLVAIPTVDFEFKPLHTYS